MGDEKSRGEKREGKGWSWGGGGGGGRRKEDQEEEDRGKFCTFLTYTSEMQKYDHAIYANINILRI